MTLLFHELSKHYNFEVFFCAPGCPNQKGNVENGVKLIKKAFKQTYINCFDGINEVQSFVDQVITASNNKMHPTKNDTCETLFLHEKALLNTLPDRQYTYYAKKKRTVSRQHGYF